MKIVGKILWWDQRDQNGVITDSSGNEFYFDVSVIEGRRSKGVQAGTLVLFEPHVLNAKIPSAKQVLLPKAKSRSKLEKEFQKNLQLSLAV